MKNPININRVMILAENLMQSKLQINDITYKITAKTTLCDIWSENPSKLPRKYPITDNVATMVIRVFIQKIFAKKTPNLRLLSDLLTHKYIPPFAGSWMGTTSS